MLKHQLSIGPNAGRMPRKQSRLFENGKRA